jgi:predicted aldo/keto reductase-like oxidoreductase
LETFKAIIDCYDGWECCQIQYNWVDTDVQAGTEGLRYAAARGLPVVVMEPIRGGRLADLPQLVREVLYQLEPRRTLAALALHYVWNRPEAAVALSGMSTMQQVVENLSSADWSAVGMLSEDDLAIYALARDKYREIWPVPCTECRYCLPCPNGVFIPAKLAVYNQAKLLGQLDEARRRYAWFASRDRDMSAKACIQCCECEERCPQHIPIHEWMPEVHALLGGE